MLNPPSARWRNGDGDGEPSRILVQVQAGPPINWEPLMRTFWVDRFIAAVTGLLTVLVITQFAVRPVAINSEINTSVVGYGDQFEKQAVW